MIPYEKFEAWQLCHKLVLAVYRASRRFPESERYGLTTQARRAAFSAAANIAEGSAKRGVREFRSYLDISIGSLSELGYTLRVTLDLGLLISEEYDDIDGLRNQARKSNLGLVPINGTSKKAERRRLTHNLPPCRPTALPPYRPTALASR